MNNDLNKIILLVVPIASVICFLIIIIFKIFEKIRHNNNIVDSYESEYKKAKIEIKETKKLLKQTVDITKSTLIGSNNKQKIYTPDNAKHIFVCGTPGSGKTVALANYIVSGIKKDYPLLIVDGKGDMDDSSIYAITKKACEDNDKKLYIINLMDHERSDNYNPFVDTSPTVCKDMLINLTEWSEEHYKKITERYLQKILQLMKKGNIPFSFHNIIKNANVEEFHFLSANLLTKNIITKEDHLFNINLAEISKDTVREALSRFSILEESDIGGLFTDDGINISGAIKEKAVILFILNPLSYPETSTLMGKLILIDSKVAIGNNFENKMRKFFIFDEINSYASPTIIDLVNKSRSANVTCILATQSLSDLDYSVDENFREQVIENCNNYIVLRQNSGKNAEAWANIIGTKNKADSTYQFGNKNNTSGTTGVGTIKFNRSYIFHPDEIKNLKTGEAFYISKDTGLKQKIKVHKPF
jgi:Type IV secretory pathway, VirD4 components